MAPYLGVDGVERNMALSRVFPKESNCLVQMTGTGGNPDKTNFKCLLPPNVFHQYIFLILWFWYGMLFVVNSVNLVIVIFMIANSAKIRAMYLIRAVGSRKVTYTPNPVEILMNKK